MKTSLAAATAVLIATTAAGFAADLPVKAAPRFAPPVFSWSGFYVGGNAGYGWGDANNATGLGGDWLTDGTRDNLIVGPPVNEQLRPNGFTGGIQAGYNFQAGQWVTGIEVDANHFGLKDQFSRTVRNAFSGSSYTLTSAFESDWLVTVRPRVGYTFGHLLVYATGGLAVAHQKASQNITQLNLVFTEAGSVSKATVGWTAGAGAEYAFDNRWSVKAEYLYVDAGSVSFSTIGDTQDRYTASHSAHLKANIARVGLNYHFN
jgi:outer membrane immunogenic protein